MLDLSADQAHYNGDEILITAIAGDLVQVYVSYGSSDGHIVIRAGESAADPVSFRVEAMVIEEPEYQTVYQDAAAQTIDKVDYPIITTGVPARHWGEKLYEFASSVFIQYLVEAGGLYFRSVVRICCRGRARGAAEATQSFEAKAQPDGQYRCEWVFVNRLNTSLTLISYALISVVPFRRNYF